MTANTAPNGNVTDFTEVDRARDSSWFVDFMDRANAIPEYARIRAGLADALWVGRDGVVLDVGCGTGEDALELAVRSGARVLGTDLSLAMVEEARRRGAGRNLPVEFRVGDAAGIELPDGSVDGVRAKLVLMHCADVSRAASELVRVLRPGGRIAVFDYDFETSVVDHPDTASTRAVVRCLSDGHANSWSGRQMRRRFLDLRLTEVTVTPHTVCMPHSFFRMSVSGKLAQAQADGSLALSVTELADWWSLLDDAAATDRFFATLTGFLVAGTR